MGVPKNNFVKKIIPIALSYTKINSEQDEMEMIVK